eukprot:m.179673 g.179673  ORF g.179673 m.179673 type:complete len:129 (+) comp14645_c0_seq1:110-496(+)
MSASNRASNTNLAHTKQPSATLLSSNCMQRLKLTDDIDQYFYDCFDFVDVPVVLLACGLTTDWIRWMANCTTNQMRATIRMGVIKTYASMRSVRVGSPRGSEAGTSGTTDDIRRWRLGDAFGLDPFGF